MAKKHEKRQCLFTKYQFEIGVVTMPIYLVFLIMGAVYLSYRVGIALALIGIVGFLASATSMMNGYKDVEW
ncbi:MAG: hypothetical protein J7K68_03300 [Candidatus Diapherotrites archaeon]|nr:hypothetical protein [Candidatus Diapherotrites archaeon]